MPDGPLGSYADLLKYLVPRSSLEVFVCILINFSFFLIGNVLLSWKESKPTDGL